LKELAESFQAVMEENMQKARDQIEKSLAAILSGQPMASEDDSDRRLAKVRALLPNIDEALARRVANFDHTVLSSIPVESRPAVVGLWGNDENKAFLDVAYLEIAQAAASSVGRIIYKDSLNWEGTGFLISDSLLLTNQHVITSALVAKDMLVEFNYELNAFGFPKSTEKFALDPDRFILCNDTILDFCIVAVSASPQQLSKYGFCPLSNKGLKHAKGDFATIIQHPSGGYKQISLRDNQIVARLDEPPVLHYVSDTEHGSSGSPVFNDQGSVIGLHHGQCKSLDVYPNGEKVPLWIKEASRVSGIVDYVKSYLAQYPEKFTDEQRMLVNSAFNCGFSCPSLIDRAKQEYLV
jgi:endonuclease G